jgi:hypothetical protein
VQALAIALVLAEDLARQQQLDRDAAAVEPLDGADRFELPLARRQPGRAQQAQRLRGQDASQRSVCSASRRRRIRDRC